MTRRLVPVLVAAALLLALPWAVAGDFYVNVASQVLIYALLALSLNLLVGFGGLPSLGHAAFLGISAYSCAWLVANAGAPQAVAALAGAAGVIGGPILSAYPGLDNDMLPLALIVVILGGIGSLLGAFVGSFIIGFIYNFGTALFPDLAYVILFLPMVLVLVFMPQGLFGRMPQ